MEINKKEVRITVPTVDVSKIGNAIRNTTLGDIVASPFKVLSTLSNVIAEKLNKSKDA